MGPCPPSPAAAISKPLTNAGTSITATCRSARSRAASDARSTLINGNGAADSSVCRETRIMGAMTIECAVPRRAARAEPKRRARVQSRSQRSALGTADAEAGGVQRPVRGRLTRCGLAPSLMPFPRPRPSRDRATSPALSAAASSKRGAVGSWPTWPFATFGAAY
jgi:hypothetical protein